MFPRLDRLFFLFWLFKKFCLSLHLSVVWIWSALFFFLKKNVFFLIFTPSFLCFGLMTFITFGKFLPFSNVFCSSISFFSIPCYSFTIVVVPQKISNILVFHSFISLNFCLGSFYWPVFKLILCLAKSVGVPFEGILHFITVFLVSSL